MQYSKDRGFVHPVSSEITPRAAYESRRGFVQALAAGAAFATLPPALAQGGGAVQTTRPGRLAPLPTIRSAVAGTVTMEKPTPYDEVTSYNNFYEFGTDKEAPAKRAGAMKTRPWTVVVDGAVKKPGRYDLDTLLKLAPMEERVYRLRCVEGWSMVIPWVGYSLEKLIRHVEPTGSAKFVRFETVADAAAMPGLRSNIIPWPYTEGLRIDEAMHPLTLLAFGLYGEVLPNQNGAPLRLVVPWKYGFKSAKSLVAIRFVETQPRSAWQMTAPDEYGFFANVNPNVDHPRWSQATERRLGEGGLFAKRRPTLMFNGYEPQVGQLYAGLDLKKFY